MNGRPKVACAGMVTLDFLRVVEKYPDENTESRVVASQESIGGPIGRGAIAAARLGAETHLLGTCGDDLFSRLMIELVEKEGIGATWVAMEHYQSQHSFVLISGDSGHRTTVWTPQPRADERVISKLPGFLRGCDCVLMDCTDEILSTAVAGEAMRQGIPTVVDTGSYKPWAEKIFPKVSHPISPRKFFAKRNPELTAEEGMVRAFEEFHPSIWGMTDGEKGGKYVTARTSETVHDYSALEIAAVDTCGAGDVFHGAFAYAIGSRLSINEAFRLSAWAAGKKCEELGNGSIPYSRQEGGQGVTHGRR